MGMAQQSRLEPFLRGKKVDERQPFRLVPPEK